MASQTSQMWQSLKIKRGKANLLPWQLGGISRGKYFQYTNKKRNVLMTPHVQTFCFTIIVMVRPRSLLRLTYFSFSHCGVSKLGLLEAILSPQRGYGYVLRKCHGLFISRATSFQNRISYILCDVAATCSLQGTIIPQPDRNATASADALTLSSRVNLVLSIHILLSLNKFVIALIGQPWLSTVSVLRQHENIFGCTECR